MMGRYNSRHGWPRCDWPCHEAPSWAQAPRQLLSLCCCVWQHVGEQELGSQLGSAGPETAAELQGTPPCHLPSSLHAQQRSNGTLAQGTSLHHSARRAAFCGSLGACLSIRSQRALSRLICLTPCSAGGSPFLLCHEAQPHPQRWAGLVWHMCSPAGRGGERQGSRT